LSTAHAPSIRCLVCFRTREKCSQCKWKCICGLQFLTRTEYRYHLYLDRSSSTNISFKGFGVSRREHYRSDDYIMLILHQKCCKHDCIKNWSYNDIKETISSTLVLSVKDGYVATKERLINCRSQTGGHQINRLKYDLKLSGKTVCPKAFSRLNCVSDNKLRSLCSDMVSEREYVDELLVQPRILKNEKILSFLQYLSYEYGEPSMEGDNRIKLTMFENRKSCYDFLKFGVSGGLNGDFDGCTKLCRTTIF